MKRQMAILAGLLLTGSLLTACGTSAGNSQISSPDSSGQTVQETESPAKAQEETASGGQENTSEETTASEDQADAEGILSSFTATDLEGNEVDQSVLADYDLTVINVWATFCGPCIQEMPALGELADEYQDKGVQIIGLVSDVLNADGSLSQDQIDTAKDIVEETGADYLHLLPSQDLYGILAQISAVPTTFFVDSQGRQVGQAYVQAMSKSQWEEVLKETLTDVSP